MTNIQFIYLTSGVAYADIILQFYDVIIRKTNLTWGHICAPIQPMHWLHPIII